MSAADAYALCVFIVYVSGGCLILGTGFTLCLLENWRTFRALVDWVRRAW